MALALPYEFDTTEADTLILRGAAGLLAVVVVGLLYSLLVSHNLVAVVQLLLIGAAATYFSRIFVTKLEGLRGTIRADVVVVQDSGLYGLRLPRPCGTFGIQRFEAVRVELAPAPIMAQGGPHERVYLVGKAGTPNLLIARSAPETGRSLGAQLATAIGLPYVEQSVPY